MTGDAARVGRCWGCVVPAGTPTSLTVDDHTFIVGSLSVFLYSGLVKTRPPLLGWKGTLGTRRRVFLWQPDVGDRCAARLRTALPIARVGTREQGNGYAGGARLSSRDRGKKETIEKGKAGGTLSSWGQGYYRCEKELITAEIIWAQL